jgi:hypothetical protein
MLTRILNAARARLVVLLVWTSLVVALGVYHHWRFEVHFAQWLHEGRIPFYPVWLLSADVLLIAAGFGLFSVAAMAGRTRSERFRYTFWVGFVCFAAAGNVVFDAWRQLAFTMLH